MVCDCTRDEGLPMQWVTADSLYGNSPGLRELIHMRDRFYVMALGRQHRVQIFGEGKLLRLDEFIPEIETANWERMCFSIGEKGLISRYGGDQFLILMPDTDARTAEETGDRLRGAACEAKIYRADQRPLPPITLSGGLAQMSEEDTPVSLVAATKWALHQAKREGGDRLSLVDRPR